MICCQLTIKVSLFLLEVKSKSNFGPQFYRKLMQNYMEATIESLREKVTKYYLILQVDFLGKSILKITNQILMDYGHK